MSLARAVAQLRTWIQMRSWNDSLPFMPLAFTDRTRSLFCPAESTAHQVDREQPSLQVPNIGMDPCSANFPSQNVLYIDPTEMSEASTVAQLRASIQLSIWNDSSPSMPLIDPMSNERIPAGGNSLDSSLLSSMISSYQRQHVPSLPTEMVSQNTMTQVLALQRIAQLRQVQQQHQLPSNLRSLHQM